jgi:cardiolipin synthase
MLAAAAGRACYGRLLRAGVEIYETEGVMIHAKTAVVDGVWFTVGSSNMDWRSLWHNAEVNVVGIDATVGHQLEALFAKDSASSRRIDAAQWARRGWPQRLTEWLARRVEFFL